MKTRKHRETLVFDIVNEALLILLAVVCLMPLINVLALSFSSSTASAGGRVGFWPVEFTLNSYEYVAKRESFWQAMLVSVKRCALGVSLNMLLCVISAYPLSKDNKRFHGRTVYAWYIFITILIGGGLIPWYMTIQKFKLLGTVWALVLPGAVPVFNVVLLLNFFRNIPGEMEEASLIDGASQWTILFRVYIPLSLPAIATICLFSLVGHWNSWFDGLILMRRPEQYPLQSYLQTVVVQKDLSLLSQAELAAISEISDRTVKCAQIFLAALPMLVAYPFFQRYFVKGLVMGAVKG